MLDIDTEKRSLNLLEDFLVMILNEHSGYFYQVSGWTLNCAVVGAVLADLSLHGRIDTDENSMFVINQNETGDSILDFCLKSIASSREKRTTGYWIEDLAQHSELIVDLTLKRLVKIGIFSYYSGGFYAINNSLWYTEMHSISENETAWKYVKSRIAEVIYTDTIPDPRDSLIVSLLQTCDVLRFIFDISEREEERIKWLCDVELISRAIFSSVQETVISPSFRKTPLSKRIPTIPTIGSIMSAYAHHGNMPAIFADLTEKYGPVYQYKPPFKEPFIFISGPKVNAWCQRNARLYMTSGNYFRQLEEAYGASGLITSLDGADHFRLRKIFSQVYTKTRFYERIDEIYGLALKFLKTHQLSPGQAFGVREFSRLMINMQMTQILVNADCQDIFKDIIAFKERASISLVGNIIPKFFARTPEMKRRFRLLQTFVQQIEQNHTPMMMRTHAISELANDLFSLHESDPQFLPEQNLPFMLAAAPLLQSMYVGDVFGFALIELARQPDIASKIREESHNVIKNGKIEKESFSAERFDITRRFLMECLRLYPVVSMQVRNISNSCTIEDYALPLGNRVHIVQTACHYMESCFPEPLKFDIDRYLPPRREHRKIEYCPYGLGTHTCNGFTWAQLKLILNIMTVAHHYEFVPQSRDQAVKISPFPTLSVTEKHKIYIHKQINQLPA